MSPTSRFWQQKSHHIIKLSGHATVKLWSDGQNGPHSSMNPFKDSAFKSTYHVDAFYNFDSRQWLQKSTNDILPKNAWFNQTWRYPKYPLTIDTIILEGRDALAMPRPIQSDIKHMVFLPYDEPFKLGQPVKSMSKINFLLHPKSLQTEVNMRLLGAN